MTNDVLKVERIEDFAILTITRGKAMNAINKAVMKSLNDFFSSHKDDLTIKGVVITGEGEKAFAAGADIKEFSDLNATEAQALSKYGQDTYFLIENFHAPVIAAVNGYSLGGGCELAMACHMRVAGSNARFGQPEVNLGLIPGYGGTQRLLHLIGKAKAIELLLTADMIKADEALRLGLANHVTEDHPLEMSLDILRKIATKGPLAVAQTIKTVNQAYPDHSGYVMEHEFFGKAIVSEDAREGAAAFVEKRKANFKGK